MKWLKGRSFSVVLAATLLATSYYVAFAAGTPVKTQLYPQFLQKVVNDSTGSVNIDAGVSGQVIKVWRYDLFVASGADLQFLSNATTDISGKLGFQNSATASLTKDGPGTVPWYTTVSGESLDLATTSSGSPAAVRVTGIVTYTYDKP